MRLENKVKNALRKYIDEGMPELWQNDSTHRIHISEPELGHIVIHVEEHKAGVVA